MFGPNTVTCLFQQLKMDDRYLHRSALKVMQALTNLATREPDTAAPIVKGLCLGEFGFYNFDAATKTKTVAKILSISSFSALREIVYATSVAPERHQSNELKGADKRSRSLADLLLAAYNRALSLRGENDREMISTLETILDVLVSQAYFVKFAGSESDTSEPQPHKDTRSYMQSRLKACLRQSVQQDRPDFRPLRLAVGRIRANEENLGQDCTVVNFDSKTQAVWNAGWENLRKVDRMVRYA